MKKSYLAALVLFLSNFKTVAKSVKVKKCT